MKLLAIATAKCHRSDQKFHHFNLVLKNSLQFSQTSHLKSPWKMFYSLLALGFCLVTWLLILCLSCPGNNFPSETLKSREQEKNSSHYIIGCDTWYYISFDPLFQAWSLLEECVKVWGATVCWCDWSCVRRKRVLGATRISAAAPSFSVWFWQTIENDVQTRFSDKWFFLLQISRRKNSFWRSIIWE